MTTSLNDGPAPAGSEYKPMSQSVGGGPQGPHIAPGTKLSTHPFFLFSLLQIGSDFEQNVPVSASML